MAPTSNPTPKKGPVKLTPRKPTALGPHRPLGSGMSVSRSVSKPSTPSTAKRRDRGGASGVETPTATPGRSHLRVELDLTADSSDDDYEPSVGTAIDEEEEVSGSLCWQRMWNVTHPASSDPDPAVPENQVGASHAFAPFGPPTPGSPADPDGQEQSRQEQLRRSDSRAPAHPVRANDEAPRADP